MTKIEELQDIYDDEINIQIDWFWDSGMNVRIGDESNGWKWQGEGYYSINEAMFDLEINICKLYPDSEFAKKHKALDFCINCKNRKFNCHGSCEIYARRIMSSLG